MGVTWDVTNGTPVAQKASQGFFFRCMVVDMWLCQ